MNNTRSTQTGKRILIVAPLPPPIGGDTITSKRLVESSYWKSEGFEIEYIDTSPGEGLRTTEVRRTWKDPCRALRILTQLVFKLPRTDVVLIWANSSFIVSIGIIIMRLSRLAGKPYIVKPFGSMLAERIISADSTRRRSVVSLLNKARHVLPETRMLAAELIDQAGLDPDRIVVFPNMLPNNLILDERPDRKFSGRCIFIGQIKSEKGIFDIFEALRNRNDLLCDFYGQIIEIDKEKFFDMIASCPNCEYRGILSNDEILETLKKYDILLLPTYHPGEGYPAVIIEAFAAGLPVISTKWKAIPELVEDGVRGLLVPPSSPEHISAALDLLHGDERLYASLAKSAHEYVGRFSEESVIGDTLVGLINNMAR